MLEALIEELVNDKSKQNHEPIVRYLAHNYAKLSHCYNDKIKNSNNIDIYNTII
jgi:hypothetical protein